MVDKVCLVILIVADSSSWNKLQLLLCNYVKWQLYMQHCKYVPSDNKFVI